MTHFHCIPDSGEGIVILTNSGRSWPFLAEVLMEWAGWSGFGSIGFGRITRATTALRALIVIVLLLAAWLVYRLSSGLLRGDRRWAPLSEKHRAGRLLQLLAGVLGMVALAWSAAQPYLFVTSIFPADSGRAALAMLVLALLLVASSLFPRVEDRKAGVPS
jgi:hypothetical protein